MTFRPFAQAGRRSRFRVVGAASAAACLATALAGVTVGNASAVSRGTGPAQAFAGPSIGSGAPPRSFWGNTKKIPAAHNVLELAIRNRTNGRFPNSKVYWSFDGKERSIARQPYIDMPVNSAGRMYFYLGARNSRYYDFIEFTVGTNSINVDTTRVDRFGLKLALLLHGHDGSNQQVGEDYATFRESRAATFRRFRNAMPAAFKELATDDAPYGIPSPGNDPAFQPGGPARELLRQVRGLGGGHHRFHGPDLRLRWHAGRQPPVVRRAQPARGATAPRRAVEPQEVLPGRPGELLRQVLAQERH